MKIGLSLLSMLMFASLVNAQDINEIRPPVINNKNNIVRGVEARNFGRFIGDSKRYDMTILQEKRTFIEYTTNGAGDEKSYKNKDLIVVLHSEHESADRFKRQTVFADLAKSNDLVLVYPESKGKVWKDGRSENDSSEDVYFIKELVKKYKKKGVKKIMVTGFSSGAILTLRLACENTEGVNYFGAISGSLPEGLICRNVIKKNILIINGTDDTFIKWEGGEVKRYTQLGRILPIEETVSFFENNNKCAKANIKGIDINFNDRSSVEKQFYKCKNGVFLFYKIEGGGHTIPGGRNRATLNNMIGNTNRDIMAEREIIDFLKKY